MAKFHRSKSSRAKERINQRKDKERQTKANQTTATTTNTSSYTIVSNGKVSDRWETWEKYCKPTCIHGAIHVGNGVITGGTGRGKDNNDLLIILDETALSLDLIDSDGIISTCKMRTIFFPIADYGVPNEHKLTLVLDVIDSYIKDGKHVHIQCIGGHGRTGTVIACYLGKYAGIEQPIAYVRERYCDKAVESLSQKNLIARYTGKIEHVDGAKEYKPFSWTNQAYSYAHDRNLSIDESDTYDQWLKEYADLTGEDEVSDHRYITDFPCPFCGNPLSEDLDDTYYCPVCKSPFTIGQLI